MKFTVQTNKTRLTAMAITSIDRFEEIESILPTAQEMTDIYSFYGSSDEQDTLSLNKKCSMDKLNELLQMLEKDATNNIDAGVIHRS